MTKQPRFANTFHTFVEGSNSKLLHNHPFGDAFGPKIPKHQTVTNPSAIMAQPSAQQSDVLTAAGYVHTRRTHIIHSSSDLADKIFSNSLWGDTQFSDASIAIGGHNWKVHRWVICRQSEYFMRALEGAFTVCVPTAFISSSFSICLSNLMGPHRRHATRPSS